jgi:signal recognition particle receptor subunit beta
MGRCYFAGVAQVNPLTREVLLKLVYYGPGLGGKTTSLQSIYASAPPETRGNIVSLATPVDRTLYFDFMPLRLAPVRGHPVRVQLFTVPGQVYFNATRKLLLTGADGVVFVADSQRDRLDANVESLENLEANLAEQGRELAHTPHVIQLNKRDLRTVAPIAELERALNLHGAPVFPTSATSGEGVVDALDALVRLVLDTLELQNVFGAPSLSAPAPSFGRAGDAFDEQIGRASEQLWRDTVDRALAAARASGQATTGVVRDAIPRDVAPREAVVRDAAPREAVVRELELAPPAHVPASPVSAVVTASARASQRAGVSFVSLFGQELDLASQIERDLAEGRYAEAVSGCDAVVSRVLAQTSAAAGLGESGRDPAFVALMLGLEGPRWLAFRRLVRRARAGAEVTLRDGLEAYATLIDLVVRRDYALA